LNAKNCGKKNLKPLAAVEKNSKILEFFQLQLRIFFGFSKTAAKK
jgi:hypothetical protein